MYNSTRVQQYSSQYGIVGVITKVRAGAMSKRTGQPGSSSFSAVAHCGSLRTRRVLVAKWRLRAKVYRYNTQQETNTALGQSDMPDTIE